MNLEICISNLKLIEPPQFMFLNCESSNLPKKKHQHWPLNLITETGKNWAKFKGSSIQKNRTSNFRFFLLNQILYLPNYPNLKLFDHGLYQAYIVNYTHQQ